MKLFKLLLLLMLVASIIPASIVGVISVVRTRELLVRDAQELAQGRVKELRLKAERLLEEPSRTALSLAQIDDLFAASLTEQRAHLASVLNSRREITALTVFGPNFQRIAVRDMPPSQVAEHEARARAMMPGLTGARYSTVYASAATGQPAVTLAFPIGGRAEGFAAAEISLEGLCQMLDQEKVGSNGFAYIADRAGRLVAGPALVGLKPGADLSARAPVAHLLETMFDKGANDSFHVGNFGKGEQRVVSAYSVLPSAGWAIVSEQPIELAYRQVETVERQIALGVAFAIAVAFALAALFSRTLARPLKKFGAAALQIARGNFGVQVDFRSKNELGELAQTFNYMSAQIEAYDHETKRLYESLENGYLETIVALANSIDSKDAYTRGHSQRVGDLSMEIGRELGLGQTELKLLHYGGILHDVGKIGIVESILRKQTRLTDDEMQVMRDHPAIGDTIIQPVSFLTSVRSAVRNHHERWDGTGYPDALKGEEIPLAARIVNCADTFDACTSTRPYQKAMPLEKAIEILEGLRGKQLDPKVLDALRRVIDKRGVQVEVKAPGEKLSA